MVPSLIYFHCFFWLGVTSALVTLDKNFPKRKTKSILGLKIVLMTSNNYIHTRSLFLYQQNRTVMNISHGSEMKMNMLLVPLDG